MKSTRISSEASANHANVPGVCSGTFIRRSCITISGDHCKKAGFEDDFVGWRVENGTLVYVRYRIGDYDARDIRIERGCKLKKY